MLRTLRELYAMFSSILDERSWTHGLVNELRDRYAWTFGVGLCCGRCGVVFESAPLQLEEPWTWKLVGFWPKSRGVH